MKKETIRDIALATALLFSGASFFMNSGIQKDLKKVFTTHSKKQAIHATAKTKIRKGIYGAVDRQKLMDKENVRKQKELDKKNVQHVRDVSKKAVADVRERSRRDLVALRGY